jgi:hypothetical protein
VLGLKYSQAVKKRKRHANKYSYPKKFQFGNMEVLGLLLLKNRGQEGFERKTFRIETRQ